MSYESKEARMVSTYLNYGSSSLTKEGLNDLAQTCRHLIQFPSHAKTGSTCPDFAEGTTLPPRHTHTASDVLQTPTASLRARQNTSSYTVPHWKHTRHAHTHKRHESAPRLIIPETHSTHVKKQGSDSV